MNKLLEMLGIEKLDESTQTQVKEKLQSIIEVKAKEQVNEMLKSDKETLVEQYETKFEEYKEEITSKFSNFVDSVLDEEMTIPEKVVEFAKKGELYHELIEQFKVRLAIDEGLLDEEAKKLLKEAKEEITKLRSNLNEKIGSELDLQNEKIKLEAELYLREKCDGLTEEQKEKVFSILEGITDKEEIDRKFDVVLEAANKKKNVKEEEDEEDDEEEKEKEDVEEEEEEEEEEDDKEEKDESKGKGKAVVKRKKVNEAAGPFQEYMKSYVKTLKDNKI